MEIVNGGVKIMRKSILMAVVVIIVSLIPFPVIAYDNVTEPATWAADAKEYLHTYQLIPSELFSEYTTPIKRDEFAAVLIGIYNEACQNYYDFRDETNPFIDTVSNKYSTEIKKANIMGIIQGTSANTYSPDRNITREDTATLIYRFIKLMYPQEDAVFNKVIADKDKISAYALPSIEFCMNTQIMNGTGNDMFSPKGLLTRQEAMVLMYNICNRYKVIENGRGAAITELTPVYRGKHEMVYEGYLYISEYSHPFSFNGRIVNNAAHTLIRTPLGQSKKNQGEILFTHDDDISTYTVNQNKIFFCDRSMERGVYSTDKNGENMKLLYKLSDYLISDFSYMHVEGDWLFVGMGGMLFKMRTDGTCLSIIHKEYYASAFFAEGEYFYVKCDPHPNANEGIDEIRFSRVSLTGDKTDLIYSNKNFDSSYGHAVYNNKLYAAIKEYDMDWATGVPLIEVDLDTKDIKQIHVISEGESLTHDNEGVYIFSANQNRYNWENISGGKDINVAVPEWLEGRFTVKFDKYLYYFEVVDSDYTRYYYLYDIETGYFTDIYGNPIN